LRLKPLVTVDAAGDCRQEARDLSCVDIPVHGASGGSRRLSQGMKAAISQRLLYESRLASAVRLNG
jgi:hypothetical protein